MCFVWTLEQIEIINILPLKPNTVCWIDHQVGYNSYLNFIWRAGAEGTSRTVIFRDLEELLLGALSRNEKIGLGECVVGILGSPVPKFQDTSWKNSAAIPAKLTVKSFC